MRVIKEGNWVNPETWTRTVICVTCTAQLEIKASDIRSKLKLTGPQWDPYKDNVYHVTCPCCGHQVAIANLPQSVKDQARKVGV